MPHINQKLLGFESARKTIWKNINLNYKLLSIRNPIEGLMASDLTCRLTEKIYMMQSAFIKTLKLIERCRWLL